MTGDRPTTPGWHCHRCRSTSCRQRADSDTDHVGRVEYRPLLLTQPSSVSWLWSHTHWCPSQRPQEVMRVDGSANPTMPKTPAQYYGRPAGLEVEREKKKRVLAITHIQGGRRLAHHTPLLKIPVWWRRAVLPSLPWAVCFLSFREEVSSFDGA